MKNLYVVKVLLLLALFAASPISVQAETAERKDIAVKIEKLENNCRKYEKKKAQEEKKLEQAKKEQKKAKKEWKKFIRSVNASICNSLNPFADEIKNPDNVIGKIEIQKRNLYYVKKGHVLEIQEEIDEWDSKEKQETARISALEEERYVVFDSKDVTKPSHLTAEEMEMILKDTDLQPFAGVYIEAESKYGVNAVFLCAVSALESDWGRSRRAKEDNNLTGFGVYGKDAVGINADSGKENLLMTASHLREYYLNPGGTYYEGLSAADINVHYCAGNTWAGKVTDIGNRLLEMYKNAYS